MRNTYSPQERREISNLSPEEIRSYYAFRRRQSHADAIQSAQDTVAARYHLAANIAATFERVES